MTQRSNFAVAMLGARMHYAVPRILHRERRLRRLFTDLCATRGALRLFNLWPTNLRPSALQRLLNRSPKDVPTELIRAYTRLGLVYARANRKTRTELDRIRVFAEVNHRFCEWTCRQDWAGADSIFVYNTAALEILREARRRGVRGVVEQTIAPFASERQLLAEERARFPAWEPDSTTAPELDRFAEREQEEWRDADLIVCGSDFVRDNVVQCGGRANRCVVVPYGVDARFEVPQRSPHDGPLRVLTVGTVGLRKGTPYAIQAAAQLRGLTQFRWVGPIKMSAAAMNELGSDVEFIGAVPRSEIIAHYAWADVFLLPSVCEGSATSTYEALTAGLPVVCTPNCGSVIRDGVEGFIVPIRDPRSICDRLTELASDPQGRLDFGQRARIRAAEYDFNAYARNLIAALNSARD
jgi:glycosyltransferase involved in cell wall biosynthesis